MSTSLKDSQRREDEGLSEIGRSGNNKIKNEAETTMPNWKERIDVSIARSRKIRGSNYVQISTIDHAAMEPRCRTVVFRGFMKGVPSGAVAEVLSTGGDGGTVEDGGGEEGGEGNENDTYDCVMKMITDMRSNKVRELETFHKSKNGEKSANTAEMVWWFPKSSEQYRIQGKLQFIGSDGPLYSYTDCGGDEQDRNYFVAERKQQWGNLSDTAREQFYWENPGIPFSSAAEGAEGGPPPGGRDGDGRVLPPPDTFLLMLLYPTKIDYLRLGDNYRQVDKLVWGNAANDDDVAEQRLWKTLRVNP